MWLEIERVVVDKVSHPDSREVKLMSGELAQWFSSTAVERERDRALEKVYRNADVAMARVAAVTQVSQAAMMGTSIVCAMKNQFEQLSPADAGKFETLAIMATYAMGNEISAVGRR